MSHQCLACGGNNPVVNDLPAKVSRAQLQRMMRRGGLDEGMYPDYFLRRCEACGLESADPMQEPDSGFYEWLAGTPGIYPLSRWEWLASAARISPDATLVDVGCGSGNFLVYVRDQVGCRAIGLELSEHSARQARNRGLEVVQADLHHALASLQGTADVVTLWHVLEHVSDPVGTLWDAKHVLRPGGRIHFSVPLCPTSYENVGHDPLNQPPHHLTRWTLEALEALALQLSMEASVVMPAADPVLIRWVRELLLVAEGPYSGRNRAGKTLALAKLVVSRPRLALQSFLGQFRRARKDGKPLPDVVMVELRLCGGAPVTVSIPAPLAGQTGV